MVVLPITLIATALGIISNLSDKVQIGKLSNFFKSGITWFLGLIITIFVGILSMEGTLTSNVDGLTAKGVKAAASTFIPVVGKALGDSADVVLGSTSAICEPIADKKIVSLLEQMGGTFKVLLGIMFFVAVLLIIGLAMCIKITNNGMMYR